MKKIILLLTLALLILSNNVSYSMDTQIVPTLLELMDTLVENDTEIIATLNDFKAIKNASKNIDQKVYLIILISALKEYETVLTYQAYVLLSITYLDRNKRYDYLKWLNNSLLKSKELIGQFIRRFEFLYPQLEAVAALHSADKAKKNMLDTLAKIDSTIGLLSKKIKSKQ